ncbi:MAG: YggT family protein [Pseudomonadota bacterium]
MIVNTVTSILGGVLLLRFWMQAIRVRPPAPVAEFTFTLSDWLVRPLRRIVPGFGGYDWASLIGAFLVVLLSVSVRLLFGLTLDQLAMTALFVLFTWILWGLMVLLIVEVVFSWINPHAPMAPFVRALNEPLLRHLRRVVPPLGGLDLSVLVALILLQIALYYLGVVFDLFGVK